MENVGLIQKQKEQVKEYSLKHDFQERPNAFTDLQYEVVNSVHGKRKEIWSASFLDKSEAELFAMISEEN